MDMIRRILRIDKPKERALAKTTDEEIKRTREEYERKLKIIETQQREHRIMRSSNALRILDTWGAAHKILRGLDQ